MTLSYPSLEVAATSRLTSLRLASVVRLSNRLASCDVVDVP